MAGKGDLLELFQSLAQPQRGTVQGDLSGVRVPAAESLFVCKDSTGRPTFLLVGSVMLPPVRLENLEVRHRVRCNVVAGSQSIQIASATLICCQSNDRSLHEYFIQALGGVLTAFAAKEDPAKLGSLVESLSELFQAITSEPASTAQGLWAELALIDGAASPGILIDAWHREVDDLYDFSLSTERIEVKSSADKTRCHHFRMEQVDNPPCVHALVASMLVDRAARGVSLGELWDRCRIHVEVNPTLQIKVDAICFRSLGKNWQRWRETSFDYGRSMASLAFFDAASVPRPATPIPAGVSDIRFVADLSALEKVDLTASRFRGPLMVALGATKS